MKSKVYTIIYGLSLLAINSISWAGNFWQVLPSSGVATATASLSGYMCVSPSSAANTTCNIKLDGTQGAIIFSAPTSTTIFVYLGTNTFINTYTGLGQNQGINLFIGINAGTSTLSNGSGGGSGNIGIGQNVLNQCQSGGAGRCNYNTIVGYNGSTSTTYGYSLTGFGYKVFQATTLGNQNVGIGDFVLGQNTTGSSNTIVGSAGGYTNTTGGGNSSLGWASMSGGNVGTMTGGPNSCLGASCLSVITSGTQNSCLGYACLGALTTAGANTSVGHNSLTSVIIGQQNSGFGHSALKSNVGDSNTCVGYFCGDTLTSANALTTGSSNTYVGFNSGPGTSTQLSNSGCIGANCTVNASNAFVIGNAVNVGIGTALPAGPFDVEATGNFSTFIGTQSSPGVIFNRQLIIGGNGGSGAVYLTGVGANVGGFGFLQSMTRGAEIQGLQDGGITSTGFSFITSNASPVNTTAMTIKGNGNIGAVGVTNPAFRMDTGSYEQITNACTNVTSCTATCTAGKQVMGGGCNGVSTTLVNTAAGSATTWTCTITLGNVTAQAICLNLN